MARCSTLINFTNKPSLDVDRIFFLVEYTMENNKNPNIYKRYREYCKRCIDKNKKYHYSDSRLKIVRQFPA